MLEQCMGSGVFSFVREQRDYYQMDDYHKHYDRYMMSDQHNHYKNHKSIGSDRWCREPSARRHDQYMVIVVVGEFS